MLNVEGLKKKLGTFDLCDATFEVEAGDYFVLLGESGAGKTVVLELLAGLLKPDAGRVLLEKMDITFAPIQRRALGLVYQDHALFPHMTVRRNIAYALPRQRVHAAEALARQVGAFSLLERRPASLSMGERQRVALARTLACNPRVLMLDEPLASLDVQSRIEIRSLLRRLNSAGQTIIHVTHDYEEALALASRVAVLENGRIAQVGTPNEIFHRPRSRFVARFVGIQNFFRGRLEHDDVEGAVFHVGEARFALALDNTEGATVAGCSGCIVFESEAVTVHAEKPQGSARNVFRGTVTDVEPVPRGIELAVDVGVTLYALITRASIAELGIGPGGVVWVSFKSTAIRFIADEEAA